MAESSATAIASNALPPPPYVPMHYEADPELILQLAGTPPAHPTAVVRVRRFLEHCLVFDYGIGNKEFPVKEAAVFYRNDWDHFLQLFQVRTSKDFPHYPLGVLTEEQSKLLDYYVKHYALPARALGVPISIAEPMLVMRPLLLAWGLFGKSQLLSLCALRGVTELATKLYMDQKLIINAVVRSSVTRAALMREAKRIQDQYFISIKGPQTYQLSLEGKRIEDQYKELGRWGTELGQFHFELPACPNRKSKSLFKEVKALVAKQWLKKRWLRFTASREREAETCSISDDELEKEV